MEGGGPVTGTAMAMPMTVDGTPVEKVEGTPVESAPLVGAPKPGTGGNVVEGGTPSGLPEVPELVQPGAQDTVIATAPDAEQEDQAPPLAMAPPPDTVAEESQREPRTAESPEPKSVPGLPTLLTRVGWRVAEIGLGILLVGLVVAVIWGRRRR
jgi:hypothetical protein